MSSRERHAVAAPRPALVPAVALAAALAVALGPSALGQETFERVEPGVGDVDPLAVGLRQLQLDLRTPRDFDQVYRVPGREDLLMRVDGGLYAIFPRSWYVSTRIGEIPLIPNDTVFHVGRPDQEWLDAWFARPEPVWSTQEPGIVEPTGTRADSSRLELRLDLGVSSRADPSLVIAEPADRPAAPAAPTSATVTQRASAASPFGALPFVAPPHRGPAPAPPRLRADAAYRDRRLRELMRRAAEAESASPGSG